MQNDLSALRVLIVDDNVMNLHLIRRLVTTWGAVADTAENGQQAVTMVRAGLDAQTPYQAIIMDIHMPVMDGPTASRFIRNDDPTVLILAASANALTESELREGCFSDYLVKPFMPHDLREKFSSLLPGSAP